MKIVVGIVFLFFTVSLTAQDKVHTKYGYAAEGYDVVAYFNAMAVEGDEKYSATHKGVDYKFSSLKNLDAFLLDPEMYTPQYGGFCAYAIADSGKKIGVNPKTYAIMDGKLYLFYNNWGNNTLEKWNKEGSQTMKEKADTNWKKIMK